MSSLLDELKLNLRITWSEEDHHLTNIIERCIAYLENLTGASFVYETDITARELILERARYVYNNAADEFEKNFYSELARFILKSDIKQMEIADETV